MALYYSDYEQWLNAHGFEALTSSTAMESAINAGRRAVALVRRWSWRSGTNTSLTISPASPEADIASLDPATNDPSIDGLYLTDQFGGEYPVDYVSDSELRDLQTDWYEDVGAPKVWTRRGSKLRFYPHPDQTYTLVIDYSKKIAPLTADDQDPDPLIPDHLLDAVGWAAAKHLAYRQDNRARMADADAAFREEIRIHGADDNTPTRGTSRQVRSGYWENLEGWPL